MSRGGARGIGRQSTGNVYARNGNGLGPNLLYYQSVLDPLNLGLRNVKGEIDYNPRTMTLDDDPSHWAWFDFDGDEELGEGYQSDLESDYEEDVPDILVGPGEDLPYHPTYTASPPLKRQIPQATAYATPGEYSIERETKNLTNCAPDLVKNGKKMGCGILSTDEEIQARKIQIQNTQTGVISNGDIVVSDIQGFRPVGMAPLYDQFNDSLFNTQSENHLYSRTVGTGVMVNSTTGDTYRTYENDMPPPNTDKAQPRSNFEKTNPYLVMLQGGIDYNRYLRNKAEICQRLPGADGGANVWGDQLYADRRRERQMEIAQQDVWRNKGGIYSTELSMDRKPVGYVGYQPAYRAFPWMPPTQRNREANDWMSGPGKEQYNMTQMMPRITITKPDLTQCPRTPLVQQAGNGVDVPAPYPTPYMPPTDRGNGIIEYPGPAGSEQGTDVFATELGLGSDLIESLKNLGSFPVIQGAQQETTAGHVLGQMLNKVTLKDTLVHALAPHGVSTDAQTGGYQTTGVQLRPTLKPLMDVSFGALGISSAAASAPQVRVLSELKPTLKELMDTTFQATGIQWSNTALSVQPLAEHDLFTPKRSDYSDAPLPAPAATPDHGGDYVRVYDVDLPNTARAELEGRGITGPVYAVQLGEGPVYWVRQSDLLSTLRSAYEHISNPIFNAHFDAAQDAGLMQTTGQNNLLPNRDQYSGLISEIPGMVEFDANLVRATDIPDWTLKDLVSMKPMVMPVGGDQLSVFGSYISDGRNESLFSVYRGKLDTGQYISPTSVPQDGNDCNRPPWFDESMNVMRKPPRETPNWLFPADKPQLNEPILLPQYFPSCKRPDDINYEILTTRPTYFTESTVS